MLFITLGDGPMGPGPSPEPTWYLSLTVMITHWSIHAIYYPRWWINGSWSITWTSQPTDRSRQPDIHHLRWWSPVEVYMLFITLGDGPMGHGPSPEPANQPTGLGNPTRHRPRVMHAPALTSRWPIVAIARWPTPSPPSDPQPHPTHRPCATQLFYDFESAILL
jgi:hypothetical protein